MTHIFPFTFDKRPEDFSPIPIFAGPYRPGGLTDNGEVRVGKTVSLRKGDVTIIVTVTELRSGADLLGEVIGFEGWPDHSFQGLCPGAFVRFSDEHVFICLR